MSEHTELEKRLYNELSQALAWLENIAAGIGDGKLIDYMPNNWGGRIVILDALKDAETIHPELTNFQPGTFVTDDGNLVRGFVVQRGTMKAGRRGIPCYLVDIGGDRTTLIPCDYARRA